MKALEKPHWKKRQERNQLVWIISLLIVFSIPAVGFSAYFLIDKIPSFSLNSGQVQRAGSSIFVKSGDDLQAAIDAAKPGDTLFLEPGAHFVGNFKLPKKSGDEIITIRTAAKDSELPGEFVRIDPKKYSKIFPKLSSITAQPVVITLDGAHHYRFIGIEFGGTKDGYGNIVQIGTGEERSVDELPHHIEFDRIYMHAESPQGQRRGIAANGRFIKIQNSHIEGIRRKGDESQAIAVWASNGPVEILNNYLEGAAENILFGGGSSYLKLVPTDCLVRDNHLNKPLEWRNDSWIVKNLFEIKNGRRIKVENNLMTNNWAMAQEGTAVLFTVRADNGEATVIEDILFTNNIVRGSGNAVNVLGSEGSGGHKLSIINNIFEDINEKKWGGRGFFLLSTDWDGINIEKNTIIQTGSITIGYGDPVTGLVFRDNIVFENDYGFFGDNSSPGLKAVDKYYPGADISNNVIIGGIANRYRQSNFLVSSVAQVGFSDFSNLNLQLSVNSPYLAKGKDGKQIGARLDRSRVGSSNAE